MGLELLLEIGCEELPAQVIRPSLEQLDMKFHEFLSHNLLLSERIETYATPRRLIVYIKNLSPCQPDRADTILGPAYSVAFTPEGNPSKAAEGFAKKYQLRVEDLKCLESDKGRYLGFERAVPGKKAPELLQTSIPQIIGSLEFPKNMRWNASQFLFARPIRWLVCMLDGEVLDVTLAGITSSNVTFGHRVLSGNAKIQVKSFEDFKSKLLNYKVHFEQQERLKRIQMELDEVAISQNADTIKDSKLLDIVTYLNEHPSVICGGFDSLYLRLPREALITVMREQQKYFSLQNERGELLPKFLAVVDSDDSNHKTITLSHERVLKARLADASFFWDNDRKSSIFDRVDKLKGILFQAKLGTVFEKSVRIGKLSQSIAKALGRADRIEELNLAARLCKADLTTEMVKEFTNLQGVMGGHYARSEGISEDVCNAIYEHYRPSSLEDESPHTFEGSVLSIADKFDSLMGAFSIGLIPTGSRDPLALRRQALGIIKILLDSKFSLSLSSTADKAYRLLRKYAQRSFKDTYEDLGAFFRDRIKFILREQGYSHDEINAIVDVDFDDPVDCQDRLSALALMRGSQDFSSLATSFKRIKNIVLKAGIDLADTLTVDPDLLQQQEEMSLYRKQLSIQPKIRRARRSHQYSLAFELMASLRPEVDQFFDKVLVMADDPALQRNRLSLIGTLLQHFLAVADISEIVVS